MRKGLSVIVGIAVLLFAYSASAADEDVVTNGLVSWWEFDDGSGTSATDSWGSAGSHYNNGTLLPEDSEPAWTTNTAGSASLGALVFDGSDDYVNCGNDSSLDITTGITIEAWVKTETIGEQQIIFKSYEIMRFGIKSDGRLINYAQYGGAGAGHTADTILQTAQWYHVVHTYDGSFSKIYLNGQSDMIPVARTGNLSTNASDFRIGYYPGVTSSFNGTIDEVRIYNRALNASEVLQNYNAIPEPSTLLLLGAGLLSLLTFRRIKAKS